MAKLCNQAYHCDLSIKGSTTHRGSSPLATIDWYDRVEKVACVKNWYNSKCHCAGYNNVPCGDLAGNLIYNIPNSVADAKGETYPKSPEQRIWSETTWQTKVPKSQLPPFDNSTAIEKEKRNKKIKRNVGIGLGIAGLIAGIFALTRKKKKNEISYYDPNREQKLRDRKNEETVELIDEHTGQTITYKNPYFNGISESDNTLLYGVLGVGVLALTIIIIKK